MEKIIMTIVQRWVGEQPKVMRVLMYIAIAATIISGTPGFLEHLCNSEKLCIAIPAAWANLYNQFVVISGIVGTFITKLQITPQAKADIAKADIAKQSPPLN